MIRPLSPLTLSPSLSRAKSREKGWPFSLSRRRERRRHRRLIEMNAIHDASCRCFKCSVEARAELRGDLRALAGGLGLGLTTAVAIALGQHWPTIALAIGGSW